MTNRWTVSVTFVCLAQLVFPTITHSQNSSAANEPISAAMKLWYNASKKNIIASAEKMPDDKFNFKPTSDVRSFSELMGHIADTQYLFCAQMKGEPNPQKESVLKTKKSKAEIVDALKASFSYCDGAFGAVNDSNLKDKVGTQGDTRVDWVMFSVYHLGSHYGNIVTYLRLNGLVPPNSEVSVERK
jgi:uncharacterized damage-inducible protein DinB